MKGQLFLFLFSWLRNEAGYPPLATSTVPGERHLNITRYLKSEQGETGEGLRKDSIIWKFALNPTQACVVCKPVRLDSRVLAAYELIVTSWPKSWSILSRAFFCFQSKPSLLGEPKTSQRSSILSITQWTGRTGAVRVTSRVLKFTQLWNNS